MRPCAASDRQQARWRLRHWSVVLGLGSFAFGSAQRDTALVEIGSLEARPPCAPAGADIMRDLHDLRISPVPIVRASRSVRARRPRSLLCRRTPKLLQLLQGPEGVFPSHLFAPVHYEVGIVEWAGADIGGLRGFVDPIVIERVTDQRLRCVSYE